MECTTSGLNSFNRDNILNKSRNIFISYNKLYNESFENNIIEIKKGMSKMYEKGVKKAEKLYKKANKNDNTNDMYLHNEQEIKYEFEQFYNDNFLSVVHDTKNSLYNTWKNTPLSDLGNKSVNEFFNDINDLDLLIEILRIAAIECDSDIPDILFKKVYSFGEQAVDKIINSMLDIALLSSYEDSFFVPLLAIKILGEWKAEKAIKPIINFIVKLHDTNEQNLIDKKLGQLEQIEQLELFGEAISKALISIGNASISPLVDILASTKDYYEYHEYLAMALSIIGKDNKSDNIYRSLKKMFINYNDKIVISECLGKYGDGRAIPSLRGYLDKNINDIDKDTLYTIKVAVENLGGSIDDILQKY